MPIKPENKARYPKEWPQIRERIKTRSGNKCEGSPDFPDCHAENGKPHPDTGSKVVLTVAHLDHIPEHSSDDNLRHWCQRCHLNYDKEHHRQNVAKTYRSRKLTIDMFDLNN